jgi:uncharacterized peroxidase-related enzyme
MMAFIKTPDSNESASVAQMYSSAEASYGYLPNMHKVFGYRPEVMQAWTGLLSSIRGQMSVRRYELVTLAAARELKSSYCMLAHASVLKREGLAEADVAAITKLEPAAPIDQVERDIIQFAGKVVRDASSVTQDDIDQLIAHGLDDAEIFDIVAAAAARCFFSKVLDGIGATADAVYSRTLSPELFSTLVVGRAPEAP